MRFFYGLIPLLALAPLSAQHAFVVNPDLANPTAPWVGSSNYIRRTFKAQDTKVTLRGPVKLRDYVVGDKLELSLKAYLDLVLANNTDVEVQRVTLEVPKNAIQRAFGIFDPLVNASFNATRATQPTTNTLQGALVLSNLNQPFSGRYQQTISTGTQFFSALGWTKLSTNDSFQYFNPAYSNTWQSGFIQPLLRGRGAYITRLPISIARSTLRQNEYVFVDQVQRLIVTAENAYWDVISARERLKVQEKALDIADQSLKRARREVELGATSPLEIFQPEQNYASAEIALTQVKFQLQQSEDILRRQIAVDLDPDIRKLPLVLTEDVDKKPDETPIDREEMVQVALSKRFDVKALNQSLDVSDLQIASALNALKPVFNLTGSYQSFGRGGPAHLAGANRPGGAGDAWAQMFDFSYNTWSMGLTLNLPLRDRRASADLADSVVNKKLGTLRVRGIEQQVRQEVLNAVTQVENSRASVRLAQVALDYALKRAEADQKRYDLGVINIFFLLSAQNDLTQAQSNLVNQTVQYRRNLLTLQQRVGTLPEDKGIVIQ
ncbi:MAG: TolC family protein [Bryobacterales bacterium]|nr:TolC family protein [Bryobacterales bacterium]